MREVVVVAETSAVGTIEVLRLFLGMNTKGPLTIMKIVEEIIVAEAQEAIIGVVRAEAEVRIIDQTTKITIDTKTGEAEAGGVVVVREEPGAEVIEGVQVGDEVEIEVHILVLT